MAEPGRQAGSCFCSSRPDGPRRRKVLIQPTAIAASSTRHRDRASISAPPSSTCKLLRHNTSLQSYPTTSTEAESLAMAVSPLDSLLATFDRHIEQKAAADQRLISAAQAGPSSLALRRDEVRNLITGSSGEPSHSTSLQLSPLERAIYYEVEGRSHKLHRKQRELDFWAAYQDELADRPTKMPTSRSALEAQIADKRARLMELEARDKLRVETTRALESSAAIQRVLTTTSPTPSTSKQEEEHYATTRELLNQRDDQALAFLKTFNETRAIKDERIAVKAEIRGRSALVHALRCLRSRTDSAPSTLILPAACAIFCRTTSQNAATS